MQHRRSGVRFTLSSVRIRTTLLESNGFPTRQVQTDELKMKFDRTHPSVAGLSRPHWKRAPCGGCVKSEPEVFKRRALNRRCSRKDRTVRLPVRRYDSNACLDIERELPSARWGACVITHPCRKTMNTRVLEEYVGMLPEHLHPCVTHSSGTGPLQIHPRRCSSLLPSLRKCSAHRALHTHRRATRIRSRSPMLHPAIGRLELAHR